MCKIGKVYVIGLGPGAEKEMTYQASTALEKSEVIIGYTVYTGLIRERFPDKKYLSTPMRQEVIRCEMAMDEAMKGSTVAMVCSGDAVIYGMAGLLYEMGQGYPEGELEVVPGITAANGGAAVLGAPLMHNFAVISLSDLLTQSGAPGGAAAFLNPFENGERPYTFVEIFSQLAWGLGYCGMPHILTRFMAVKSEKELKKSSAIAIVWDILSLTAACFIGIIGRAYLLPTVLGENGASSSESVFIEMINKLFSSHLGLPFIGGIFLCGILAAIMSTADSQLLVTASAASEDLYHQFIKKDADSKEILAVARLTVIVVSVLAFVIAWNPNSSIMGLVSNAWAGLGAAFGPTVVMSLFWRRTNLAGAVAGIVSGGLTVIVWDYIPLAAGQTLGSYTGLYSLAVGFAVSLVMIIIFSLATKAPSKEITDVFDKVAGK